jgi:hypothetical protein
MRRQLRPFYSAEELARVYDHPYDHRHWSDHRDRVAFTADLLGHMRPKSVADLSCGDGAIVRYANLGDIPTFLGDYAGVPMSAASNVPGPGIDICGPIEETIHLIEPVDVFVCSETLEHIEDPDGLLRDIRAKASRLLLSTPSGESDANNPEHYWGWNTTDIDIMLKAAGWTDSAVQLRSWPPHYYTFQIWICS